jgi:hypothetical protein
MFAYSSRRDKPISTKLDMLIACDKKESEGGSNRQKNFLSSIPGEGDSCSSETMHDKRTAPRLKLFVLQRRLQEQRPKPRKTVLGSNPDEDVFRISETKHHRTAQRAKLFLQGDYRN